MEIGKTLTNIFSFTIKRLWALFLILGVLSLIVSAEPQYNKIINDNCNTCTCNVNFTGITNSTPRTYEHIPYYDSNGELTTSTTLTFDTGNGWLRADNGVHTSGIRNINDDYIVFDSTNRRLLDENENIIATFTGNKFNASNVNISAQCYTFKDGSTQCYAGIINDSNYAKLNTSNFYSNDYNLGIGGYVEMGVTNSLTGFSETITLGDNENGQPHLLLGQKKENKWFHYWEMYSSGGAGLTDTQVNVTLQQVATKDGYLLLPNNIIASRNITALNFIGNGSLLTNICLSNGTGCPTTSSMNYTNIAMLNQSNVFTKFNNFSDKVIFRNASGNTNVVIQASSGDTANQQIFQIKNNAGTSVFYQRADGFSATASLGTTDDNSVQIIDSSVATADYPRGISLGSSSVVGWGTNQWWTAKDTGLSRATNGVIAVGNGTQGSYSGRLKTSGLDIFNDGDLRLYGTFPHFYLNESDCPFGNCVNAYIIMDGNRYQTQSYTAGGTYINTITDVNMRSNMTVFSSDFVGRVGLGLGTSSAVGWTNFRNSTSTIPQMWLQNSTLSTTSSGGALQRKDNDLWFTDNSLNTTQILISRNTTRYTCDALATGQVGTNATGSYGCNGSCWGAWNGTAVVCGRRLF